MVQCILKYLCSLCFGGPDDSLYRPDIYLSPSDGCHTCWSYYSSEGNFSTSLGSPPHKSDCRETSHSSEWLHKGHWGLARRWQSWLQNHRVIAWLYSLNRSLHIPLDMTLTPQGQCHTLHAESGDFSEAVDVLAFHSRTSYCRWTNWSIQSSHIFLFLKLR